MMHWERKNGISSPEDQLEGGSKEESALKDRSERTGLEEVLHLIDIVRLEEFSLAEVSWIHHSIKYLQYALTSMASIRWE